MHPLISAILTIFPGLMSTIVIVVALIMLDCCFATIRDRSYPFVMRYLASLLFLLISAACFSVGLGAIYLAYF